MEKEMVKSPKVSIMIPVYNRKQYIGECIQSALDQTLPDFEIVIVDNASDDGTWEICGEYAARDPRVRIFRNERNIGPVNNWRRCLSESRGEYGKLLFSDDTMFPTFLERTLPFLSDSEIGFVFTAVRIGASEADSYIAYQHTNWAGRVLSQDFVHRSLIKIDALPVSPGAALFRTEDLRAHLVTEIPSPSFDDFKQHGAGPDVLLYLLTAKNYVYVAHVEEPLAFFRTHASSITIAGAQSYIRSRYCQAKIWFAESELGARRVLIRLLCRAWLDECVRDRKLCSFQSVAKRYTKSVPKVCLAHRVASFSLELIGKVIRKVRFVS